MLEIEIRKSQTRTFSISGDMNDVYDWEKCGQINWMNHLKTFTKYQQY